MFQQTISSQRELTIQYPCISTNPSNETILLFCQRLETNSHVNLAATISTMASFVNF